MLVSIQIPTYNQEQYLPQTIGSVLAQDYANIEVVVADDCSPDQTGKLVQSYTDPRVKYFRNEPNLRRVANYRQALYFYCKGSWVINLDGDDYFCDPSFISHGLEQVNKQPADSVVFFQGNHTKANLQKSYPSGTWLNETDMLLSGKDYFLNYPALAAFNHAATLYDRAKAMAIGFYNFDCLFSDFNSVSKLSLLGNVILSTRKVAIWRQHDLNESKGLNQSQLKVELESLKDVAAFAKPHIEKRALASWLTQMNDLVRVRFMELMLSGTGGWKAFRILARQPVMRLYYFKALAKSLIKAAGNK